MLFDAGSLTQMSFKQALEGKEDLFDRLNRASTTRRRVGASRDLREHGEIALKAPAVPARTK
jgi:hypothetical protein